MCVTKRTSKENWLMTVVTQILDRMSGITKPQRKFLLTLLMTMLVTRGRLNFLNLSRHSSLDEKTYRRHFQKAFSFISFNQLSIAQAVPAHIPHSLLKTLRSRPRAASTLTGWITSGTARPRKSSVV